MKSRVSTFRQLRSMFGRRDHDPATADQRSIRFGDIRVSNSRRLDVRCVVETGAKRQRYDLWFEASRPIPLNDDVIALALSTLCGRTYGSVSLDLDLTPRTAQSIETFTGAAIASGSSERVDDAPRSGNVLSFSGGFDSLAALSLMPETTQLVSMDFGGRFGRERKFFETFDTTIVSTNLTETPLRFNSWTFMGIGAILTSAHTRAAYHTFGGILDSSADSLRVAPSAAANITPLPLATAGFATAPYVLGLTEIGTLLVLFAYQRDRVADSLRSLAGPGEEKSYRKRVLAQIVAERLGITLDLPSPAKPLRPRYAFGSFFLLDFLSFYFVKHAGIETARKLIGDIPDEVVRLADELDLNLYERVHTKLMSNFPSEQRPALDDKLAQAGIEYYTENDWIELDRIRQVLVPHHPILGR